MKEQYRDFSKGELQPKFLHTIPSYMYYMSANMYCVSNLKDVSTTDTDGVLNSTFMGGISI